MGDVLLSAACIAYYGAFPGNYRHELVSGWVNKCKEYGIPVSPDCTLRGTLASPIQVPCLSACLSVYQPACLSVCLSSVSTVMKKDELEGQHAAQNKPSLKACTAA